jgi:TonB family protein
MRIALMVLFVLANVLVHSQSRQITGRVVDEVTQKGIAGATITVVDGDQKTVTNQLGYFSLNVDPVNHRIIISSIGFRTGRIDIPKDNAFKASLKRNYLTLVGLDLGTFPLEDLEPLDSTGTQKGELIKADAEYPGGWKYFYNEFASALQNKSYRNIIPDTARRILFTVSGNGSVVDIKIPDGADSLRSIIEQAFTSLKKWQPARQNQFAIPQHFELPFQWTKEARLEDIVHASPVGGSNKFYEFVGKNIRYPAKARNRNITGRVYVGFFIEADGSLGGVRAVKGIGFGCDEEAVRVVSMSQWNPGTHKGRPMRQYFTLPVAFAIEGAIAPDDKVFPKGYHEWMTTNIRYPIDAKRMRIEGDVVVSFKVSKAAGKIDSIRLLEDTGNFGREVMRVLRTVPRDFLSSLVAKDGIIYQPVQFRIQNETIAPEGSSRLIGDVLDAIVITSVPDNPVIINHDFDDRFGLVSSRQFDSFGDILAAINGEGFESFEEAFAAARKVSGPGIFRLHLARKNLKVVPPEIKNLKSLTMLDIEGNNIQSLPPEIGTLKKLFGLHAPENELKELPIEFGYLKSLRILVLANNRVEDFPKPILILTGLTTLDLSGNLITSLPSAIGGLRKLDNLHLHNNNITTIPEEFYQLTQLKVLTIGGNSLSDTEKRKLLQRLKNTDVKFD